MDDLMKEEAGMIRIAIATLAIMMIAVPVAATVASDAPTRHVTHTRERSAVSQDEVVALAKDQGLRKLSDIAYQNGVWSVEGVAKDGSPLEINISSAGEILNPTS